MRSLDFSPLHRTAVGFDHLTSLLDAALNSPASDGYPPYNIAKRDGESYEITVAVAGFTSDEIDVEVRDNQLVIAAKGAGEDGGKQTYLHRGIARRNFRLRFQLADHVVVRGADLRDGLLVVDLEREIPEALKPRKIPIGGSPKVIDGAVADAA